MTIHLFTEKDITPTARVINLRNYIDSNGPHMVSFGHRCTVADAAAGVYDMWVDYETDNGLLRSIRLASFLDLASTAQMAYWPDELVNDVRHPLGDGAGIDPYGTFRLNFAFVSAPAAASKITYECRIQVDDGSPAIQYHP